MTQKDPGAMKRFLCGLGPSYIVRTELQRPLFGARTVRVHSIMAALNISKKRKFVADGVFYSELNEVCLFHC